MVKSQTWLFVQLLTLIIVLTGCNTGAFQIELIPADKELKESRVQKDKGWFITDKIAIIDVEGTMENERQSGLLQAGENPVSVFIEKLDKAAKDPDVKAIVLRMDSPGGTVVAADIMYHSLKEFKRKTKKPVVVCVTGMACSGGYYLACAGDGIVAQPSSVIGNIGTIFQTFSIEGTMQKIGVKTVAIKSGQLKDIGSPLHNLSEQEKEVLEGIIKEMFQQFVSIVRENRKSIGEQKLQELTDGRVFTAKQALDEKLIDKTGYLEDGIAWAKELANVDKAKVVIYHRPSLYTPNSYSSASASAAGLEPLINIDLPDWLSSGGSQFLYLWQPGLE
ncbi:MAG: signal peptide peptidase SppA [Sedimentisphaerales bacterium]|nr:signal peptide peptidase SppA [Sedimentisphaerales bacterium]